MSNKNILYIGGFELPDKNAAAHRVVANAKLLEKIGYNTIFVGVEKKIGTVGSDYNQIFGFKNFPRKYPTNIKEKLTFFNSVNYYKKIIKTESNVEAVICYNMPSLPLFRLKRYCNKHNIKIIADCTEWYKTPIKGNFVVGIIKRIDSFLRMNYVHLKMDGVIAISEYLYNFYTKKGVKTIKVPPLIDSEDEKWKFISTNQYKMISLVYAGGAFSINNSYVKDRLDIVVESLSCLKKENFKFNFKVIGCTYEEFEYFYPNLKNNLKILNDSISFLGRLNHEETINCVKKSDYSIFLRDENIVTKAGFPTKFVESISCGTLVLTNSNSNVIDYLKMNQNGFIIDMKSIDSINQSVKMALSIEHNSIKQMKIDTFNSRIFDFRNYIELFDKFLNDIFSNIK